MDLTFWALMVISLVYLIGNIILLQAFWRGRLKRWREILKILKHNESSVIR